MQLKCSSCGAVESSSNLNQCNYCGNIIEAEKAKEFYEASISSESGRFILIAETALEGGNYKEAIDYYNKSIEKVFNNSDAWLEKGIAILYSSTLGDIKTTEAISCWKNAIKFASDPNSMQKRVSKIINNAVQTFYPNIENHYALYKNLNNTYSEFVEKFLLLENALSYAISIDDSNLDVLENGYELCLKVISAYGRYNKSGVSQHFDAKTNDILNQVQQSIENLTIPDQLYEIEKRYVDTLNKLDSNRNLIPYLEIKLKNEEEEDKKTKAAQQLKIEENLEHRRKKNKKYLLVFVISFVIFFIFGLYRPVPDYNPFSVGVIGSLVCLSMSTVSIENSK